MEMRPASDYDLAALADLFTRGYEGYVIPFALTEDVLAYMVRTFDLDLDASRVAVRDGEPVGLANLGVRGEAGWIGGVGVVAAARRQGVARALMEAVHEQARERGLREVWLEVIVENTGAAALYEQLGYEDVREVEVWQLDAAEGPEPEPAGPEAAGAIVAARRAAPEPWQRADGTLAHLDDVEGIVVDGAAALYRVSNGRVSLFQIEADEAPARAILERLRTLGPVSILNLPAGDPAGAAFAALGGIVAARQRELRLPL